MSGPVFLTQGQVEALHRIALEQHGGRPGVRDRYALEAAVIQPRNVYHYTQGDNFDIAAGYAFYLAQAQAFIDGNKRTGMAAALVFLRLNGATVRPATGELHAALLAVAERRMGRLELAALLRRLARA